MELTRRLCVRDEHNEAESSHFYFVERFGLNALKANLPSVATACVVSLCPIQGLHSVDVTFQRQSAGLECQPSRYGDWSCNCYLPESR